MFNFAFNKTNMTMNLSFKSFAASLAVMSGIAVGSYAQQGKVYTRKPYTPEQLAQRLAIPVWKAPESGKHLRSAAGLPRSVNNSKQIFMPPVFEQRSNSCSQASGIRYVFTYEVNRMLNRQSAGKECLFSYLYTWNYLNEGKEEGSHPELGYNIAKVAGVPTTDIFDDDVYYSSYTKWMTGYDNYIAAMKYRVKDMVQFPLKTEEGIQLLKQYLYNKGEEGKAGGLVTFSCYSSDWGLRSYHGPSSTGLEDIIVKNGTDGAHALTIVGYDDDVQYDLNGDGTVSDDERGAFIFVNSWGTWWATKGYAYYPYKLFMLDPSEGGLSNLDANALGISVEEHTPQVVFKAEITYDSRNDLSFELSVSDGAGSSSPRYALQYPMMTYQGGDFPMQGYGSSDTLKTIKVAMNFTDMTDKYADFHEPRYTLTIRRVAVGDKVGGGTLRNFSVEDFRTGKTYLCNEENIEMSGGRIVASTALHEAVDVSQNREQWSDDNGNPSVSPFIIRRADGRQTKVKFGKSGDGVTIRYQHLK